ncbi:molybdenum ABC transporter ATP-binding protein ModC [Xenorhabdus hominickii]|uniref:Iron ABC transporter, ATP-binding protein n=1 Tax=Xenorhabdus hominickii TaxID=351679 RepID=A0A2G0QAL1_XENHO|nr:molybdenum ABC transporter ATP-binding protein ModC [Xenorhabdus hominickii]AOM40796.1 molybdenum ABC transporter ATP-binding protein [Xenorhabdus hominickii]PHM56253.1 iron ABC transporter, ATP-binding protein [Xenorhabdus hominickii]
MLELDFEQCLGDMHMRVNTTLPTESITAIFGLSGAGKTSLINVIAGLSRPQKGRISLNGRILVDMEHKIFLPPEKRRIGYVFQDARLFPHYRVKGNLQYGMAPEMKPLFENIIGLLGIEHLLSRFPITLSGGEKQRVAIGRALLTSPEILLMDEPLASLDLLRKRELLPYLEKLSEDVKIPILYISHSLDEVLRLADNVIVMDKGKIRATGLLEDVWSSSALRPWLQKESLSSILKVSVVEHNQRYHMTAVAAADKVLWLPKIDVNPGADVRIRIDASDVSLVLEPPRVSSIRNTLQVKVIEFFEDNGQVDVKLALSEHYLWARITSWAREELNLRVGQWLYAQIKSVSLNRHL